MAGSDANIPDGKRSERIRHIEAKEDDMNDSLTVAVVSSLIAGVFGLLGKYLEVNYEKNVTKSQQAAAMGGGGGQVVNIPLNYGLALKQIGILQLAAYAVVIPVGFLIIAVVTDIYSYLALNAFVGTVVLAAGFYWIAKNMPAPVPWKHLSVVAVGTAIVTYTLNMFFLQSALDVDLAFDFGQFALAFIQPFAAMGLGGGILHFQRTNAPASATPMPSASAQQEIPVAMGGGGMSSRYHLFGRSGDISTKVTPIDRQEFVIGRGTESHLRLKDPSVSRTHAKILTSQKGIYIRDEKSGIGTFVNGARIAPGTHVLLNHGDMIGIGDKYLIEFRTNS